MPGPPVGNSLPATASTIFFLGNRRAEEAARALDPSQVVLGSSGGWLAMADELGALRIANPVTGEQAELPAISTLFPIVRHPVRSLSFFIDMGDLAQVRFAGAPPNDEGFREASLSIHRELMRLVFYRKVVLSSCRCAAMLILNQRFGTPAFAKTAADGGTWRLAPSRDGVEDAVYHNGRFYSVSYSGVVEAWDHDRGGSDEFTSRVVAAAMDGEHHQLYSKYLVATPDGRLMIVLRHRPHRIRSTTTPAQPINSVTSVFKVHVLVDDDDQLGTVRQSWKETTSIGDAALFVGVNTSLCMPTSEHPELKAGCVYFTDDDLWESWGHKEDAADMGVYSLEDGTVQALGTTHQSWPLAA
ncbi:hypothetical protein EJB05_47088, partial [Eragrostis curvula]